MYSTSDPDICRTSDGLPCVMWEVSGKVMSFKLKDPWFNTRGDSMNESCYFSRKLFERAREDKYRRSEFSLGNSASDLGL
ncbi:hypothetical protein OUZ56_030216 [Daphnia magna]|uniref:Uncharacterized protein n=1 Tax=Daphnia magna TaxID=35525 RepID=A0ABQ9ZQM7_9CRUS|nr:hypothetical protein OUZ56_030216 [Daphnia magna]